MAKEQSAFKYINGYQFLKTDHPKFHEPFTKEGIKKDIETAKPKLEEAIAEEMRRIEEAQQSGQYYLPIGSLVV